MSKQLNTGLHSSQKRNKLKKLRLKLRPLKLLLKLLRLLKKQKRLPKKNLPNKFSTLQLLQLSLKKPKLNQ
jgi:hypothetical protein